MKHIYRPDGTVSYEYHYLNNRLHRAGGPAIIYYRPEGTVEREHYYLIDGVEQ